MDSTEPRNPMLRTHERHPEAYGPLAMQLPASLHGSRRLDSGVDGGMRAGDWRAAGTITRTEPR